jgi:hypothetical protein
MVAGSAHVRRSKVGRAPWQNLQTAGLLATPLQDDHHNLSREGVAEMCIFFRPTPNVLFSGSYSRV